MGELDVDSGRHVRQRKRARRGSASYDAGGVPRTGISTVKAEVGDISSDRQTRAGGARRSDPLVASGNANEQVGYEDETIGQSSRCARCVRDAEGWKEGCRVEEDEVGEGFRLKRTEDMTSEAIIAAALAAAPRTIYLRHPHLRRIYLTFFILVALLVLVPCWSAWYAYRPHRPRRSWSVQRCVRVRWSRLLCGLVARCEIDHLGRNLGVEMLPSDLKHSHAITIPAAPERYLQGHAMAMLDKLHESRGAWIPRMVYRPDRAQEGIWGRWNAPGDKEKVYGFEPVVGFWFTGEKATPDEGPKPITPGDPVGLHFHGGGYLCGTAAETDLTSSIPKTLVVHSPIHHILSIDYRLAPTAPWPLPLLDAISAYVHLVMPPQHGGMGVAARDIVLFGDSAGGHLALALLRWLRDEGPKVGLEMPRGVVLMSPWVDVGFTTAWGEGKEYNKESDVIDDTFGPFASSLLCRAIPGEVMHESAYLSPGGLLVDADRIARWEGEKRMRGLGAGGDVCESGDTVGMFTDYPPTFVVYGGAERLGPSIRLFYERLCRDSRDGTFIDCDTQVTCDEGDGLDRSAHPTCSAISEVPTSAPSTVHGERPVSQPCKHNESPSTPSPLDHPHKILVGSDAVHDFLIFPWMQEEAAVVYRELDVWLRQLLGSGDIGSDSDVEEGVIGTDADESPYEPIHPPHYTKAHLVPATPGALPTPTAFVLDEPTSPPTPFVSSSRPGMGRRMSSMLLPASAGAAGTDEWAAAQAQAQAQAQARRRAQQRRRDSRRSILVDRSPVIEPQKVGVRGMVHDMRAEAMTYLNLDGDCASGKHGPKHHMYGGDKHGHAREVEGGEKGEPSGWLASQIDRMTPFTAQLEKGEWDWEMSEEPEEGGEEGDDVDGEGGRGWYDLEI